MLFWLRRDCLLLLCRNPSPFERLLELFEINCNMIRQLVVHLFHEKGT